MAFREISYNNGGPSHKYKSYKSFRQRLSGSFLCALLGGILFFCAPALLWWNEGRAVYQAKTLAQARSKATTVPSHSSWNNGKLVHVTGFAGTSKGTNALLERDLPSGVVAKINKELKKIQNIADDDSGAPDSGGVRPAILLKRKVEYFEWIETSKQSTRKTAGGGEETTTTYSYKKGWTSNHVDSSRFHETRHSNYKPKYKNREVWTDGQVKLYDLDDHRKTIGFVLNRQLLQSMGEGNIKQVDLAPISWRPGHEDIWTGYDDIGDHRFTWEISEPHVVSVIGQQQKDGSIRPWKSDYGVEFHKLVAGHKSYDEIISIAESENTMMTWLLRVCGAFLWYISFTSIAAPLGVVADLGTIPCVGLEPGTILNYVTGTAAFLLALLLSFIVISTAWLWYRPLFSATLFGCSLITAYFLRQNVKKKTKFAKH